MTAATKGFEQVVRVILGHGCDINIGNSVGATALHLAAMTEMPQCVALLLEGVTTVRPWVFGFGFWVGVLGVGVWSLELLRGL